MIPIVIFVINLLYFGTNVQMNVMHELKSTTSSYHHPNYENGTNTMIKEHNYEFREENCALLFFGVPRCFKETFLSIKKNILSINPNCDIYVHTYNITTLPGNPRNQEKDTSVNVNQVYQLTNNVTMSTMDEFSKKHDLKHYRKFFPPKSGWIYPISMDNMIKQWHSIESVWKFMESTSKSFYKPLNGTQQKYYYNKVGLFRIDQVYLNPINISNGIAVKGDFNLDVKKLDEKKNCNDRLFYGLYNYSKVWATGRFDFVPAYMKSKGGVNKGLHSETFLYYLTTNKIKPKVEAKHICAVRVRNNCSKRRDCLRFKAFQY